MGKTRLALDWSFGEDRPETSPVSPALGLRLASLPSRLWSDRCYFSEGRAWIGRGLALVDEREPSLAGLIANALSAAAVLAYEQYEIGEARRLLEMSIAISRSIGGGKTLYEALGILARLVYFEREPELAHTLIEDGLRLSREYGDRWNEAMALSIRGGFSYWRANDYAEARRLTEESIHIFLETGDRWEADANYSQLAAICVRTGEAGQARVFVERAIQSYREMKDPAALAFALEIQGDAAYLQKDYGTALASLQEALMLRRSLGHQDWALSLLSWLGFILVEMGKIEQGEEYLTEHLTLVLAEGLERDLSGVLIGWSGVVLWRVEAAWAARLLGYVSRLYEDEHFHPGGPELALFDRTTAAVRSRLEDRAFEAAWVAGCALPPEQARQEVIRAAEWFRNKG